MAVGLYIHVPFCIKKCNYCDFISLPYDAELAASYVYALKTELSLQAEQLSDSQRVVRTIFIGGGTPTVLSGDQLGDILAACREHFRISEDVEITVECNPGTVTGKKLRKMKRAGVNRISLGVQAFQERLLTTMGRIHKWPEVEKAVSDCRMAGIENISFDLMFGIPGQTMEDWEETLDRVLDLKPRHISAYALKLEPGTPFHLDVAAGKLTVSDEDLELNMYLFVIEYLTARGFIHYEISNFALPGVEARHNLIYWHNEEYLGLGPAAHSKLKKSRFSNTESVELYIDRLRNGHLAVEEICSVSTEDEIAETVFLGLRLLDGLDLDRFQQKFGENLLSIYDRQIKKLGEINMIKIEKNRLKLTGKGLPLANEVFVEFI